MYLTLHLVNTKLQGPVIVLRHIPMPLGGSCNLSSFGIGMPRSLPSFVSEKEYNVCIILPSYVKVCCFAANIKCFPICLTAGPFPLRVERRTRTMVMIINYTQVIKRFLEITFSQGREEVYMLLNTALYKLLQCTLSYRNVDR